jgi:branched-subunit amino acid permease
MGILFIYSPDSNTPGLGDNILYSVGLYPWEPVDGGIHITPFYSLIFFIPSFIVGHKFKNNFGATLGKILSLIIIIILLILAIGCILHKMHLI